MSVLVCGGRVEGVKLFARAVTRGWCAECKAIMSWAGGGTVWKVALVSMAAMGRWSQSLRARLSKCRQPRKTKDSGINCKDLFCRAHLLLCPGLTNQVRVWADVWPA